MVWFIVWFIVSCDVVIRLTSFSLSVVVDLFPIKITVTLLCERYTRPNLITYYIQWLCSQVSQHGLIGSMAGAFSWPSL